MKHTAFFLIAALAFAPVSTTAQEKGKGKGSKKQPTAVEQSTPKPQTAQEKAKGKSSTRDTVATSGSTTTQGAGSCSPDTTPPVIHSVSASPDVLWSPNHRMTPVSIAAKVTDNCPGATWAVTSISSDEPVNGTGEGDTQPDWSLTGAHAVNLRAERAGSGDGRIYTITITARDAAGHRARATTTVSVPHSQRQ